MIDVTVVTTCHRQFTEKDPPRFYEKHGHKRFDISTVKLVESIRRNGGQLKNCKIKVWIPLKFKPSAEVTAFLLNNGCELEYGEFCIEAYPNSSKIDACNTKFDTEFVMWIDSDSHIRKDFSGAFRFMSSFDVSFPPMNLITNFGASKNEDELWKKYYAYFYLRQPTNKIVTLIDKKLGHFYFTSAIMIFKNDLNFGEIYKHFVTELFKSDLPRKDFRFSQTALSLMATQEKWRVKPMLKEYAHLFHLNGYSVEPSTALCHYADDLDRYYKSIGVDVFDQKNEGGA